MADLQREFGPHYYGRRDLHITEEMKQSAIQRAGLTGPNAWADIPVLKKEGLDGIKFFLDAPRNGNGAEPWVLFRVSGTEPLLRVYTEAASPELVREILSTAEAFVRDELNARPGIDPASYIGHLILSERARSASSTIN